MLILRSLLGVQPYVEIMHPENGQIASPIQEPVKIADLDMNMNTSNLLFPL